MKADISEIIYINNFRLFYGIRRPFFFKVNIGRGGEEIAPVAPPDPASEI